MFDHLFKESGVIEVARKQRVDGETVFDAIPVRYFFTKRGTRSEAGGVQVLLEVYCLPEGDEELSIEESGECFFRNAAQCRFCVDSFEVLMNPTAPQNACWKLEIVS